MLISKSCVRTIVIQESSRVHQKKETPLNFIWAKKLNSIIAEISWFCYFWDIDTIEKLNWSLYLLTLNIQLIHVNLSFKIKSFLTLESLDCILCLLDKKARFARDRAARGWSLAYHGSCIDPMDQSKPLDPTLKVAGARRIRTIRLLVNDKYIVPSPRLYSSRKMCSPVCRISQRRILKKDHQEI